MEISYETHVLSSVARFDDDRTFHLPRKSHHHYAVCFCIMLLTVTQHFIPLKKSQHTTSLRNIFGIGIRSKRRVSLWVVICCCSVAVCYACPP